MMHHNRGLSLVTPVAAENLDAGKRLSWTADVQPGLAGWRRED